MTESPRSEDDQRDDELMDRLAEAFRAADPPPPDMAEVAMRALTWDVELSRLATEVTAEPVLLRDSTEPEAAEPVDAVLDLTYAVDDYVIDLSVEPADQPGGRRVSGLVAPRVDQVEVVAPGQAGWPVPCDQYGRFEIVIDGPTVAIGFTGPDGRSRRTPLLDL